MGHKIIIALDGISARKALDIATKLKGRVWGFKINDLLFEPGLISKLKKIGKIFADAKLYDIPSTVARSVVQLEKVGADMITIHASGGAEMIKAAKLASQKSKLLGVTVLTSKKTINQKEFLKLVGDLKKSKLDGVVCSAYELEYFKNFKFLKVVPGIRPKWYKKRDDQSRTVTPDEAIKLGADFLVIGRPIVKSKNPVKTVTKIIKEL